MIYQVLIKDKSRVVLARLLSHFNTPVAKYPKFGVWTYFIVGRRTITILDPGPKFSGFLGRSRKLTYNAQNIVEVVKQKFPQHRVNQVLLSHYHFDHSQSAPELQQLLSNHPPIRVTKKDRQLKTNYLQFFPNSLIKIWNGEVYSLGKDLQDQEYLSDTSFQVYFASGHTTGNIALVSHVYKVIIGGWWLSVKQTTLIQKLSQYFIDEDKKSLSQTKLKFQALHYTYYFHHPVI